MASFTDTVQSFNPYVSQVPVDAYNRAELYRQGKYDQGVQATQGYIDEATGLNVPDKYKGYLQNSVNSLQDQIKKVAGGDFSNMQLVNQIGGAATKIIKDPIMQAGIQSQAVIDNGVKDMKKAQSEGKSNPVNDWFFGRQVSDWNKNSDLSQAFNGGYIQHRDYQKKWMDAQEKLGASERTTDLPFLVDDQGRYIDKTGKLTTTPVLNDVMVERTFKGKDPEKIKAAIMSNMDEGDIQQMQMDGMYHYKDYTPEQLRPILDNSYNSTLDQLDKQESNYKLLKGLNLKNTAYQKSIDDALSEISKSREGVLSSRDNDNSLLVSNPDAIRSKIYSTQSINDFANTYSNKDEIEKIVNNPYYEKLDKDRSYSLAVDKYKEEQRHNLVDEGLSANKFSWEVAKDARDNAPGGSNSVLNPGSLDMGSNTKIVLPTVTAFLKEAQDQKAQMDGSDNDFLKNYYSKDEKGNPIAPDKGKRDLEFYRDQFNDGKSVPAAFQDYFSTQKPLTDELNRKQTIIAGVQQDADKQFAGETAKINQSLPGIKMGDGSVYSSSTVLGLASKLNKKQMDNTSSQSFAGGDTPIFQSQSVQEDFENSLTPQEKNLYNLYKSNRGVLKMVDDAAKHVAPKLHAVIEKKDEWANNELLQRTGQYKPVAYTFNTTKTGYLKATQDKMAAVIDRVENQGGETGSGEGHFDVKEARSINSDPEAHYTLIKQSGANVTVAMNNKKDPTNYIVMPRGEFENLFNTPITAPNQKVADVMNYTKGVSTNVQHPNVFVGPSFDPQAYKTAYFSKSANKEVDDFPNVKNYTVKADIGRLPSGKVASTIYVKTPTGDWKALEGSTGDIDATVSALHSMSDDQIKVLLTQNK